MSLKELDTENADRDLTSLVTVLTHTPTVGGVCMGLIKLGDGTKNLDGTGGDFQLVITVGGQTVQPSPQTITFSTAVRGMVWTTPFPVVASDEVIMRVLSPNAADTDVDVTAYLYDTTFALPAAAADAAGGLPISDAGGLDLDAMDALLIDIDAEVDIIHDAVQGLAVTGSALTQIAEAPAVSQPATGTETSGTYASTNLDDGVFHIITAASNTIDQYYQFEIGESGSPVDVVVSGYLKETVPAGGDSVVMQAYNFVSAGWETIKADAFVGIVADGPSENISAQLLARNVGTTGADDRKVRIRFYSNSLEAGTTLNIDLISIGWAESVVTKLNEIITDTNELQGDWMDGGRLDLIIDAILADTNELQGDNIPGTLSTMDGKIDTIDGIVDSILVDTGTDIPATLATIAGYLDTEIAAILADTNAILVDTNELQSDDIPGLISALNNISTADVNAQVLDVMNVDTHAEPGQGAPGATISIFEKINYLYKAWRNKKVQDATTYELYDDAGTTVDQKAADSDDGTDATVGEIISGP